MQYTKVRMYKPLFSLYRMSISNKMEHFSYPNMSIMEQICMAAGLLVEPAKSVGHTTTLTS